MSAIVASFAVLVTAHVAIVAGLAARHPRVRGLVARVVLPLAPYWGFRERRRGRSSTGAVALVLYVAARGVEHSLA